MPLDSIFIGALAEELDGALASARVDKLQQPAKDELRLHLRTKSGNKKLLISASPSSARLHLTERQRENPQTPPMFCMLLRKHLSGAALLSVRQEGTERIVALSFDALSEFGERAEKKLIVELFGALPNIILADAEGRIVDCLRKISPEGGGRKVLPGLFYRAPDPVDKKNPFEETRQGFFAALGEGGPRAGLPAEKWLLDRYTALSPAVCREIVFRGPGEGGKPAAELSGAEKESLWAAFFEMVSIRAAKAYTPFASGREVSFTPLRSLGEGAEYAGFSPLLDGFYGEREERGEFSQKSSGLLRSVASAAAKLEKKLGLQRQDLKKTEDRERLRQFGDILSAHIHELPRGAKSATLQNFYDEEGKNVEIPLKEDLTPQRNAARYYKEYSKMKSAERHLSGIIEAGEGELLYLRSVEDTIRRARSSKELDEIRAELEAGGYVKKQAAKPSKKEKQSGPLEYKVADGFTALVGRNNGQNDLLTTKLSRRDDVWFHVKNAPGSHVVLQTEGRAPTDRALTDAANLAAAHSSQQGSGKVAVDFTRVRFVKKPGGAKPGMVVYEKHETAIAIPADGAKLEETGENRRGP